MVTSFVLLNADASLPAWNVAPSVDRSDALSIMRPVRCTMASPRDAILTTLDRVLGASAGTSAQPGRCSAGCRPRREIGMDTRSQSPLGPTYLGMEVTPRGGPRCLGAPAELVSVEPESRRLHAPRRRLRFRFVVCCMVFLVWQGEGRLGNPATRWGNFGFGGLTIPSCGTSPTSDR